MKLSSMITGALALSGFALFASSAYADHYGMAGCGLGSQVFKEDGKVQILAATTNGTSGTQTFGITSGTSNCRDSKHAMAANYINVNEDALKKDAARGEGEVLSGLSKIYGCENTQAFNQTLKQHYAEIFDNETDKNLKIQIIHKLVNEDDKNLRCSTTKT